MLEHVEAVVLERQAVQRGIFREASLRHLIDETKSGANDRSFLLLVLLICLIVFGPSKLPELGKGLGEGIRGFRDSFKSGGDSEKK